MRNLYYLVWVGAITNFKKYNPQKEWKNHLFFLVSFIMSLNLATINLWLKFFDITFITSLQIDFFEGTKLNDFIEYFATYCLPFAILNFFLIFYNNRYEKLIKRYPDVPDMSHNS
jgi:hypothetical protein